MCTRGVSCVKCQVRSARCQVPRVKFHVSGKDYGRFIARMFGRGNVVVVYDRIILRELDIDMSDENDFCQEFMIEVAQAFLGNSRRTVDYLRYGTQTIVDKDMGRNIIGALSSVELSDDQIDMLEKPFNQAQEHLLAWVLAEIDGNAQKPDWPDRIRLVDLDTSEVICDGNLQWMFASALLENIETMFKENDLRKSA